MGGCSGKPTPVEVRRGDDVDKSDTTPVRDQKPITNDDVVQQMMADMDIPVGIPVNDSGPQNNSAGTQRKSPIATAYEQSKCSAETPPSKSVPEYPEKNQHSKPNSDTYPQKENPDHGKQPSSSSSVPPNFFQSHNFAQNGQQNADPLSQLPDEISNIVSAAIQQAKSARASGNLPKGSVFTQTTTTTYSTSTSTSQHKRWM